MGSIFRNGVKYGGNGNSAYDNPVLQVKVGDKTYNPDNGVVDISEPITEITDTLDDINERVPDKIEAKGVTIGINTGTFQDVSFTGVPNSFVGEDVWSDGDKIYFSNDSDQYIFDKSTLTWSAKTWNGLTNFYGSQIWTDGENIYYSNKIQGNNIHYVLNKETSTWSVKTWSGLTDFIGQYIWTDGNNIYCSGGTDQYVLNKSTATWSVKTWSGLTDFYGTYVWSDGTNIYYSFGSTNHYILDITTSTWSVKTWSGNYTSVEGSGIWTDGENIYFSNLDEQYVLDKPTSAWLVKSWGLTEDELYDFDLFSNMLWTDGENIYLSRNGESKRVIPTPRIKSIRLR